MAFVENELAQMGYDSDKWDRRASVWPWFVVVIALAVVALAALS